jgi:ATP-dependent RNA helicase RhlE
MLAEIETYLQKPVERLEIKKNDYLDTLDFTEDVDNNWKALLKEADANVGKFKKKKKK